MKNKSGVIIISLVSFVLGLVCSFAAITYVKLPLTEDVDTYVTAETAYYTKNGVTLHSDVDISDAAISFHFLELGNKYTGDCTYVKTDTCDILIDCGSKVTSIPYVCEYLNGYVTDGKLEYVIITHAHQDHYAGFATSENVKSIFDLYDCENIITFSKTNQKSTSATYKNYLRELKDETEAGANHFTAADCVKGENGASQDYSVGTGVNMRILDSYYYYNGSATENDYSVCTLFTYTAENGTVKNALFTGDLEEDGEAELVNRNSLPEVDLYKAGHHGSKTSSTQTLLNVIKPKTVCVCCCAGSPEYTKNTANQFPTQQFINNVAKFTDDVYVTTLCVDYAKNEFASFNGNIAFLISKLGETNVICSANNVKLKDSAWFKENRIWNTSA